MRRDSLARKYFGTDGIRGKVGGYPITADFMLKLGWAVGRVMGEGQGNLILIGKDTRISGYMFESALEAGITAAGMDARLLGPMPTPAIAYLTRTLHACAGIVISASHNPYFDNGVKFFSAQGTKLADEIELAIEAEMDKDMVTMGSAELGRVERVTDAPGRYIEFCKSTVPMSLSLRGMKIVVDCAHGATYHVAPNVFDELGAEVIPIGVSPDGLNINQGCGSTHVAQLQAKVRETRADLGVALDGDGDRLIMVDHTGEIVDGDQILYIIACSRQRSTHLNNSAVVGTLMSNLGLEHALRKKGIALHRAGVGDRYVMEMLIQHGCILGGESSGHIICLDRTTTGDGIVSALQVLAEIVLDRKSLHALAADMTKYPQILINVALKKRVNLDESKDVQDAVKAAEERMQENGRVLLRPSGTEPVVRVMVEGNDVEMVQQEAEKLATVVEAACQ